MILASVSNSGGASELYVLDAPCNGYLGIMRPNIDESSAAFPIRSTRKLFVQCLRSRKQPNADILEFHRSALLVHYANISYRLGGEKLVIDADEQFVDNPEAMKMYKPEYRKPWTIDVAG